MTEKYDKNREDNRLKKQHDQVDDDSGSSESGTSGSRGGQVEFKEFVGRDQFLREDLLPPEERKRLLIVHTQLNESSVKKQKARRDEYNALKAGQTNLQDFRQTRRHEGYKPHTILADKRQFSGSDKQVNPLGNENISETNNEKKNELQYKYELQNRPQYVNAPRATPKPSPFNK